MRFFISPVLFPIGRTTKNARVPKESAPHAPFAPSIKTKANVMIKDGRGKTKRVDTVENAAVPVDKLAVVADALVALDRAHRHIAGKSHGGHNHAHYCLHH